MKKYYPFDASFQCWKNILHGVGLFANDVIQTFINDRIFPSKINNVTMFINTSNTSYSKRDYI